MRMFTFGSSAACSGRAPSNIAASSTETSSPPSEGRTGGVLNGYSSSTGTGCKGAVVPECARVPDVPQSCFSEAGSQECDGLLGQARTCAGGADALSTNVYDR